MKSAKNGIHTTLFTFVDWEETTLTCTLKEAFWSECGDWCLTSPLRSYSCSCIHVWGWKGKLVLRYCVLHLHFHEILSHLFLWNNVHWLIFAHGVNFMLRMFILCIWCNEMVTLFSTYCTLLLLLYAPPFWNASIFSKYIVLRSEACFDWSCYLVRCDWSNTSNVRRKCYALTVMWCRVLAQRDKNNKTHNKRGMCCIQWGHNYWL